jgi:outer membrane protein assembly factor BamB
MPLVDIGNDQVIAAHSNIISDTGATPSKLYKLSLEGRSVKKMAELPLSTPIVSPFQYREGTAFAVTSDGSADNLITLSVNDAPAIDAQQKLDDRYVAGPWLVGDLLLLQTDQDELVSFDLTLQRQWAVKLGNVRLAGPPVLLDQNILLTISNGMMVALSPTDGSQKISSNLQQPLAKAPVISGGSLWIPGSDGIVHLIDAATLK